MSFTGDLNVEHSRPSAFYIPIEVCEKVIDMVYGPLDDVHATRKNMATLHSCALVCRAWRVRSQTTLFFKVLLLHSTSLHLFAAILDSGRHLCDYVHQVTLSGYHLHNTTSIFATFPVVLAQKLPNLERVNVIHLYPESHESCPIPYPRLLDLPKDKCLPYIPLHRHFQTFLSSFTTVSFLQLTSTTFRSFTEFARMLHGLPNLKVIICDSVRWITPSGSHPGAEITEQPDWAAGTCVLPPFAPKLQALHLLDMSKHGVERLIWTRGPHLTVLNLTVPLSLRAEEDENGTALIDLSPCTGLETLYLSLVSTSFSTNKHYTLVTELLASWNPQHAEPVLIICPFFTWHFTRRGFGDALLDVARIIEPEFGFQLPRMTDDLPTVRYRLSVTIYDSKAYLEWWWHRLNRCFPTWARLEKLSINFYARESHPRTTIPLSLINYS
ncbi:hypothetical protein V8D89_005768 [Ganoderma adspersum]